MTQRDYKKEIINVIKNNELSHFLCGYGNYKITVSGDAVATQYIDTEPTYIDLVLNLLYTLYSDSNEIKEEFENALCTLANGNAFEIFVAVRFLNYQLLYQKNGKATFSISVDTIADTLKYHLPSHLDEIINDKQMPTFMYTAEEEIEILNKKLKQMYNISIL